MSERPFVTIAMPCLNEEAYIESCVRSVLAQDYPKDRLEILVADGMSIDRTREILRDLEVEDPRVRMLDNPDRYQAPGMNHIIREARGEVIVRMDVHCEYAPNYVSACVDVLERTAADNAGGAQRARAKSWFQKALCAALDSPLGVGGASYRSPEKEGFVDTVFLGAFRRRVFETVGMYDPGAITNEDAELNQRLIDAGGKVYLSPEIEVYYYPRDSFSSLAKQYFKYGRGRARTLLKHRKFLSVRPAIPFLTTTVGALLLVIPPLHGVATVAFGTYAAATAIEAVRVGRKAGAPAIPIVWAIFPVLHASHGAGFAAGLVSYALKRDWSEPELLGKTPASRVEGEADGDAKATAQAGPINGAAQPA